MWITRGYQKNKLIKKRRTVAFFISHRHTGAHVDQANISAEKAKAIEDARIPHPLKERQRCFGFDAPPPQGPREAHRLTGRFPCPYMPRKNRLTGSEIRRLKPEKRLVSSLFSLSVTRSEGARSKIATVVSKKVSGKAVDRNTIKRRMRSVLAALDIPQGFALVVTAKKAALGADFSSVTSDLSELVARLRGGK